MSLRHPFHRTTVLLLTALVCCALTLAGLGAADAAGGTSPASAERPAPTMKVASRRTSGQQVQHVTVNWRGTQKRTKVKAKQAVVPGIGELDLVCQPNKTMIRLWTPDRGYETQMWMQKYEDKQGSPAVSVKTARVYRWADADDNGRGGTGFYTHEGLNQRPGVENYAKGFMNGIISQRSSRSADGPQIAQDALKPVTTFELTWYWNGFNHGPTYRSCKIDAVFTTKLANRMSVTWHGDDDADGNDRQSAQLPGVGFLDLACSRAASDQAPTFTVTPYRPGTEQSPAELYVEQVTGEGRVTDHVDHTTLSGVDPETGAFPSLPLPRNGTLRIKVTNGNGNSQWLLVSSYFVLNNSAHPQLNLCELAAGQYQATFD